MLPEPWEGRMERENHGNAKMWCGERHFIKSALHQAKTGDPSEPPLTTMEMSSPQLANGI